MKLSELDPSEVKTASPGALKLSDLSADEVTNVPESLIGLSGPGSKDENPNDVITSPKPATMMPSPYAMPHMDALDTRGSVEAAKTVGSFAGGELGGAAVRAIPIVSKLAEGASTAGKIGASMAEGAGSGAGATIGAGNVAPKDIAKNAATFGALGAATPLAGKAIEKIGEKAAELAPKASTRMVNRAIDKIAQGSGNKIGKEVGAKPIRETLRDVMSEGKGRDIVKNAGDAEKASESIQREIDKRMEEKDKIVRDTMDRYVADGATPGAVMEDATVKTRNVPMNELVSDSRVLPPMEGESSLIKRDGVPAPIENEPPTAKAPRETMAQLTGAKESTTPLIEMRQKGSLDPTEMKAKIVDKANKIGRDNAPQKTHVLHIVGNLEKEMQAEIEATGADPDLFWWRRQQTKMQDLSKPTIDSNIDHTINQEAHAEVAKLIGDEMNAHIDNPRFGQLNKEVSALIKLRNANMATSLNASRAGKSPGVFGHKLIQSIHHVGDIGAVVAGASGHPYALAIPALTHGVPMLARNIDRALIKIARAKVIGQPTQDLIAQALKIGASQEAISEVLKHTHAQQTGETPND